MVKHGCNEKMKEKKPKYKTLLIVAIIVVIVVIMAAVFFFGGKSSMLSLLKKGETQEGSFERIEVTKENLPTYLESLDPINDLPDDASIQVQLYHFEGDERVMEESYVITQGNVEEGEAHNPDIVIVLHSDYVKDLGNFCSTLRSANKNGDLGIELNDNAAALLWKYKSIVTHKSCLGL